MTKWLVGKSVILIPILIITKPLKQKTVKNTIFVLFILCVLTGCNNRKLNHKEIVTKYYKARDAGNYDIIKRLVNDSITIISGDYNMPYNHDSFYEQFKWDSIFQPSYNIIELEEKNDYVIASISLNSARNEFLKNKSMTCKYKMYIDSGKISKIEELECINANWNVWQKERDSLVSWINLNHSELNGFIHDMTMDGAINYLKAIKLYKANKNDL